MADSRRSISRDYYQPHTQIPAFNLALNISRVFPVHKLRRPGDLIETTPESPIHSLLDNRRSFVSLFGTRTKDREPTVEATLISTNTNAPDVSSNRMKTFSSRHRIRAFTLIEHWSDRHYRHPGAVVAGVGQSKNVGARDQLRLTTVMGHRVQHTRATIAVLSPLRLTTGVGNNC